MGPGFPNPFGFDFTQLMRMLQSQGPVNLDVARQVATAVATADPGTGQPRPEPPVDPDAARALDDVVRAAQTFVADATGISEALGVRSRSVDRATWAAETLQGLAPVFESLAAALGRAPGPGAADAGDAAPEDAFVGALVQSLMPVLLGVWSGWMVGELSHQALGQYDLPLPLAAPPQLLFVARNVDEFAAAWSLPRDEVHYALALRESVHGAQRSVPWVRERLVRSSQAYVGAYELRADALEEQLSGLDLTDPSSVQQIGNVTDAGALLGAMRSERQGPLLEELQRYVSVLEGYADVVVEALGERMVSSHARIDEALRRHRLERGRAASFVDRLLGLELDRGHYEAGLAFCRGVVERAGMEGLNRLWEDERMVPTRAELEAPGLWLARIELG
ncbi:MAG: hypothetical protein KatS3mg009_0002 [Acidimicrobiia bacterium]|nr:MAG: hypothetical protein KatS3mg009_0002 [Acidimicrobiia bacterium]